MSLRANRVAEQMKQDLGKIIDQKLKNPKVGFVTVTDVEVTEGLQEAKIFVSVLGTDEERARTMQGLEESKGFLRTEIGKRIRMYKVPELRFEYDHSIEQGNRIEQLIRKLKEDERER